jgi:hypothetical protein
MRSRWGFGEWRTTRDFIGGTRDKFCPSQGSSIVIVGDLGS